MKIYLARHAESTYNTKKLLNSDPTVDVELTEQGIQQAQRLAESLKDVLFDTIFVSEFQRTQQTAEIINAQHDAPIVIDPRLNENISGYEGDPVEDWRDALKASGDVWNTVLNGGESLQQAFDRVQAFCDTVTSDEKDPVLIIAHGSGIQAIYGRIKGIPNTAAWNYFIPQGEFALFEI